MGVDRAGRGRRARPTWAGGLLPLLLVGPGLLLAPAPPDYRDGPTPIVAAAAAAAVAGAGAVVAPTPAVMAAPVTAAAARPAPFPAAVERWRPLALRASRLVAEAEGEALDADLLLALVQTESGGDPLAASAAGAVGLMQLRDGAHRDVVRRHPRLFPRGDRADPAENLLGGALYLVLCARYLAADLAAPEGLRLALHAYNHGPGAIRAWRGEAAAGRAAADLPPETRAHAERALAAYASARPGRG
jgi:soluble lytic murein transglycosylase-like protein